MVLRRALGCLAATLLGVAALVALQAVTDASRASAAPMALAPAASVSAEMDACVRRAMREAQPLFDSIDVRGTAQTTYALSELERIRSFSQDCEAELFGDGTAERPSGGLLGGDGFSFTAETCPVSTRCDGGDAPADCAPGACSGGPGANG
jgi:hypothetical protein